MLAFRLFARELVWRCICEKWDRTLSLGDLWGSGTAVVVANKPLGDRQIFHSFFWWMNVKVLPLLVLQQISRQTLVCDDEGQSPRHHHVKIPFEDKYLQPSRRWCFYFGCSSSSRRKFINLISPIINCCEARKLGAPASPVRTGSA